MKRRRIYRDTVLLVGFDVNDDIVERKEISYEQYYEESNPIVDEDEYRSARGIRHIQGTIYGERGAVLQQFETFFDERGAYVRGRALNEDGSL